MAESQIKVTGKDAMDEGFSILNTLNGIIKNANDKLFVNWYRYDEIDIFKAGDLSTYFDDIWFPDVDDIDIFDNSLDWIVTIRHDGQVFIFDKNEVMSQTD